MQVIHISNVISTSHSGSELVNLLQTPTPTESTNKTRHIRI